MNEIVIAALVMFLISFDHKTFFAANVNVLWLARAVQAGQKLCIVITNV